MTTDGSMHIHTQIKALLFKSCCQQRALEGSGMGTESGFKVSILEVRQLL